MKYIVILSSAAASAIILVILSLFLYTTEKSISLRTSEEITKLNEVAATGSNIAAAFLSYSQKAPNKQYALAQEAVKADSKKSIDILREHNKFLESQILQRWKDLAVIFISFITIIAGVVLSLCMIIYYDKKTLQPKNSKRKIAREKKG